ncbi:MAG: DNA cytosine methyltransferase [Gammaproteobacteria bacterium]|nr:DNA cytosine methyltransferase [Gammaproteobacteria bacterium]
MYQMTLDNELIVDNFAGGGGASCGIEMALHRPVNIAINHDREAVGMHEANHPLTTHYCEDVWDINPRKILKGRPVLLAWFSPDCKHFSKAKGGRPVEKKIRGLAWVVLRWASLPDGQKPKIICLENVEEFTTWGPLTDEGRPCPKRKGQTFNSFVNALKRHGYRVEWKELRACDYGVPTIRKRLFLIARCDGQPIVWPEPTHGQGLLPYRTAAECIDWSIPCPSIFERDRPLAENTMKRIAKGIQKFVIDAQEPFILNLTHGGRLEPLAEPFKTITAARRGEKAVVVPAMIQMGYGERKGQSPRVLDHQKPLGTVTAGGNKFALCSAFLVGAGGPVYAGKPVTADRPLETVATENHRQLVTAFLAKHFGGVTGVEIDTPLPTITTRGTQTQIVTSHVMKMRGHSSRDKHGHTIAEPLHTISASGTHFAEVRAFLLKYYGTNIGSDMNEPMHSVTTKDRFGLVTIHGEDYAIVDIGMRMLTPRELYRAQGFPDSYIIDRMADGAALNKTAQVRMCGNSVCPPLAAAIVRANVPASVFHMMEAAE